MITELLVIQQIDLKQKKVKIHQIQGRYFQWTFHTDEEQGKGAPEYFPFELNGKYSILRRGPGAETKLTWSDELISFKDDYGVPGGSVVAILFPKGFIPDMLQFKNAAYLPVNFDLPVNNRIPGYLQLYYNFSEKRSALVIHVNERTVFGFKCIAKKVSDEDFPKESWKESDEGFDVTINRQALDVDHISENDLKVFNNVIAETMDPESVKLLLHNLNDLLASIKEGNNEKSKGLLEKVGGILNGSLSVLSGIVTIADSYTANNSAAMFVKKILMFLMA